LLARVAEALEPWDRLLRDHMPGCSPEPDDGCGARRASAAFAHGWFGRATEPTPKPGVQGPLRPREREVLRLVAAGLSNAQVGPWLVIAPRTARSHVASILSKLCAHNRAQAVSSR